MRARCVVLSLCALLLVASAPPPRVAPVPGEGVARRAVAPPDIAPGELIVGFRPDADAAARVAVVAAHGGRIVATLAGIGALVVTLPTRLPLGTAAAAFAAEPIVRYAEPNARYRAAGTPDDPRYAAGQLWGLDRIAAPAAWEVTTGDSQVVVGILDSGLDATHPDLAANIWSAPAGWTVGGCAPGTHGYSSFGGVTGCATDDAPTGSIVHGHGTHIAGTIGAVGNNGTGVVGVNWRVGLMALRCMDPVTGAVQAGDAARVIEYAVAARQAGVDLRVLNLSWTASAHSQALLDAINLAGAAGILIVTAAGDGDPAADDDRVPQYPAAYAAAPYNLANMIAATATDRNDAKGTGANFGRNTVHLAAPGIEILSTMPGGTYGSSSGTSLAAAHVSGAAALLLANERGLTLDALRSRLLGCGDPLGSLAQITVTGRRLNVARALANTDCRYTLDLKSIGGGQIVATPAAAQYPSGAAVGLTAIPQDGYRFDGWTLDGAPAGAGDTLSLTMLADHRVAALFGRRQVTLTLLLDAITHGSVAADPPGPAYDYGAAVTITATSAPGFRFSHWALDESGTTPANPLTLTLTADRTARAVFAPLPTASPSPSPAASPSAGPRYDLELVAATGGAIVPSVAGPYPAGSRLTLAARPAEGYRFTGWTVDDIPAGTANPLAMTINAPHRVAATFVRAHLLTLAATSGGSVAVAAPGWTGGSPYPEGMGLTLTATTATNGVFTGWTIDGAFAGWASPLTLTMDAPHDVVATFAPRPRFGDLPPGPPPYEAIAQLAARNIIRGYENGDFGPADLTLRAQMAALIVRAMGWEAEARENTFTDRCLPQDPANCVDNGLWRAVGILAGRGVARGYGDGTYGARDLVLHAQVVAFIARAMVQAGYWTQQPDDPALYPNVPLASGHREDLATFVRYAGAVPGTDPAAPWPAWDQPATRGWFALALWQALDAQFAADRTP